MSSSIQFNHPNRQRAYGAGRIAHLKRLEDELLFILFYFRQYPTQEVQGFCLCRHSFAPRGEAGSYGFFGMSQAQANGWIHRLSGLLNQALGYEMHLPERRAANLAAVLSAWPSLEFIIDGTERPINRPKDKDDEKGYYVASQLSRDISACIQAKFEDSVDRPHLLNSINANTVRRSTLTTQPRNGERYLWQ